MIYHHRALSGRSILRTAEHPATKVAETIGHHPEGRIHGNELTVTLSCPAAGDLTDRDLTIQVLAARRLGTLVVAAGSDEV